MSDLPKKLDTNSLSSRTKRRRKHRLEQTIEQCDDLLPLPFPRPPESVPEDSDSSLSEVSYLPLFFRM